MVKGIRIRMSLEKTSSDNKQVLIIDDSMLSRNMIKDILQPVGYKIHLATGGQDGIEKAFQIKPDCILLDLLMPEVSGFDVLQTLQSQLDNPIPVIVLTADIQDTSKKKCLEYGARYFLNKPPKQDILLETLDRLFNDK